jgi:hypothetical protein
MSSNLQIAAILNKKYALTKEDAEQVYPSLDAALKENHSVSLSFEGLENCSTIFLRYTLGKLYLSYGTRVDELVKVTEVSPENEVLPNQIKRLRERALNPGGYESIFNQAIGEA